MIASPVYYPWAHPLEASEIGKADLACLGDISVMNFCKLYASTSHLETHPPIPAPQLVLASE